MILLPVAFGELSHASCSFNDKQMVRHCQERDLGKIIDQQSQVKCAVRKSGTYIGIVEVVKRADLRLGPAEVIKKIRNDGMNSKRKRNTEYCGKTGFDSDRSAYREPFSVNTLGAEIAAPILLRASTAAEHALSELANSFSTGPSWCCVEKNSQKAHILGRWE